MKRACSTILPSSKRCSAPPLRDGDYCFWHDPDHAEAVKEARRLGGQRRKREGVVSGAFDFEGLASIDDIRRLIEVAVIDTLQLENSVARNRTLGSLAATAVKLLEAGELADRVAILEEALGPRLEVMKARR